MNELDKLSKKEIWMYSVASFVILVGWIVTIIGLFIPPPGEIHSTVLIALGQSLAFGAAIFGVIYYVKSEVGEFKSGLYNKIMDKIDKKLKEEYDNIKNND